MSRFLQGAATVGILWIAYEWNRNPLGHRGGEETGPELGEREFLVLSADTGGWSMAQRTHGPPLPPSSRTRFREVRP